MRKKNPRSYPWFRRVTEKWGQYDILVQPEYSKGQVTIPILLRMRI
jgi:hypothetical protein